MTTTTTTWQERLEDSTKVPLAPEFVESLELTAAANKLEADHLWKLWNAYTDACRDMDQSGFFREFCQWNKLTGAGPLA